MAKFKTCAEHPDVKGSLDCAECCAKLREINTSLSTLIIVKEESE